MKGTIKIISVLLVVLMLVMIATPVLAAGDAIKDIKDGISNDYSSDIEGYNEINATAGTVITIIRYAAIVIGVVLIAVFGIKFMLGSAEEKAEYKKSFIPLIVGIVVVFGATYIAQLIFNIAAT